MWRTIVGLIVVGVCLSVFFGVWRFITSYQMAAAQDAQMRSSFVAASNNETSLSIRGWNRSELDKILADFFQAYGVPTSTALRVEEKSGDAFVVTFPDDIEPRLFLFLVNYIQYPRDFELARRSIGVVGRAKLTPAFGVPDAALVGRRATIYVPANDNEYDLVYAQVEFAGTYRIPFTSLIWEATEDARVPASASGL